MIPNPPASPLPSHGPHPPPPFLHALSLLRLSPDDLSVYLAPDLDLLDPLDSPDLPAMPLWDQLTSWPDDDKQPPSLSFADAVAAGKAEGEAGRAGARGKGRYAREACQLCRQRKLKCDERRPCGQCVHFRTDCESQAGQRRGRKPRAEATTDARGQASGWIEGSVELTEIAEGFLV
ncbi:hypothetical protein GUITHDRAFT_114331 [Guillardia theta CCMP2712]|uniref:Zn(2)-C6 fungal-type domain-containing protein n=1 Tax=Guillardia theta (strain CCMP2712) TaxID=905079 RepID=L1IU08_GUITC|nr:hypothetical protein GUITHDRAFT_114331 [Guillardia theta CCMP2712]EKX39602.1 hypothetical protein GUITHDRAFT_114331 [Guillardia theta CCMP2712]|eukprot:XP_005826582.1 hypothetical protein GUITHDRAFT_114331 [Guillardia theta CCMP2712]